MEKKVKKERAIRIFNLSEDVWPFIESYGDKKLQAWEIEENVNLADKDLFSMAEETEFTFITAKPLDPKFVEYFKKLCEVKDLEVLVTESHSGKVCDDILEDKKIMKRLLEMKKEYKRLSITSYSASQEFLYLVKTLRDKGMEIQTPAAPEESDAWTVNFYGSKSGIRQLTQINGAMRADLKMPDGVVSSGIIDTAGIAANKYIKEKGVVIKTNKGHSGQGVLIFHKGDLPQNFAECERKIKEILRKDSYWEKFPIVVESLITPNPRIGGGFPNTEFIIKKDGEVKLLFFCGMRVDKMGVFAGIEIGEETLPKRVASRIIDIGYLIGEQYAEDGYRGYFDIDFTAAKNGEIFVNESNVRVTGGSHMYNTAVELAGRDFTKKQYVLCENMHALLKQKKFTFEKLINTMEPILFSRKTKEGLVVCSSNALPNYLSYIIFGKNKKRAEKIEAKMKELLGE